MGEMLASCPLYPTIGKVFEGVLDYPVRGRFVVRRLVPDGTECTLEVFQGTKKTQCTMIFIRGAPDLDDAPGGPAHWHGLPIEIDGYRHRVSIRRDGDHLLAEFFNFVQPYTGAWMELTKNDEPAKKAKKRT